MAILKGFPPSCTISPYINVESNKVTRTIVETKEMVGLLNAGDKFKMKSGEYCVIHRKDFQTTWLNGICAVCYLSSEENTSIGGIYNFQETTEVTWLREVYR